MPHLVKVMVKAVTSSKSEEMSHLVKVDRTGKAGTGRPAQV
jgi:hypothetical protein